MRMEGNQNYSVIFRCGVPKCPYTTTRLFNLQRHLKTHTKEHWRSRRFLCPCCTYGASTRSHLKRHMRNKHPTENIDAHDLSGLSYEDADAHKLKELSNAKKVECEMIDSGSQQYVDGPVTVLQMVTPLSTESEPQPGEMYYNASLEGEAFRFIPVAMLPSEAATQDL